MATKTKTEKYFIAQIYVPEIKRKLWHVCKRGITIAFTIDAFDEKCTAETYCKFLNK